VALTCRHFGISRQSFYRWQKRYDALNLTTLESRSHRPHRRRQPTWSLALAERVLALRLQFPRWGKDKLAVLLRREQLPLSVSMVGRMLRQLKQQGRLIEADAGERGSLPFPCIPSPHQRGGKTVRHVPGLNCEACPRPFSISILCISI